jgi:hypothetical protein
LTTDLAYAAQVPDAQIPSWSVLVSLMVHGPDIEPTVRGTIRSVDGTDETRGYATFSHREDDLPPVVAGAYTRSRDLEGGSLLRVWKDGPRIRIEESDGSPNLIVGSDATWSFDRIHDEPLKSSRVQILYGYRGTRLLGRRTAEGFLGHDFTTPSGPIGSTTFLGRQAWTVELAPPASKPYPLQLVVDAETGLLLQQRNDGFGTVDEYVEFVLDEELDPSLFVWDGPTRSEADERAKRDAEHEADMARRRAWVAENVSSKPLRLSLDVEIFVHMYDEDSGAFEGSLDHGSLGSLSRRPTSSEPWDLHWRDVQHRWSDDRWDWALTLYDAQLDEAALEAIKRQLVERD